MVAVEKVNITIADVDVNLELIVRLGNLVQIVERVFDSLDLNPLLISLIGNATNLVGEVIGAVDGLVSFERRALHSGLLTMSSLDPLRKTERRSTSWSTTSVTLSKRLLELAEMPSSRLSETTRWDSSCRSVTIQPLTFINSST